MEFVVRAGIASSLLAMIFSSKRELAPHWEDNVNIIFGQGGCA